jgi:hypothetical protein
MADGLIDLFTVQYKTLLNMKLQQKTSLLRETVESSAFTGAKMVSPLNLIDAIQMKTPEGRFAPKKNTPNGYQRRWIAPIDKEGDQFVDNFDMLKTPIDPKSKMIETAASAVARAFDDEIIRALFADATIGADPASLTTETFDTTAFRVSESFGASGSVGLTVAKLNEARRILEHYHNTEELNALGATLVIGSTQHADLRNQALVTSSDFNKNGGILTNGRVTEFMGFKIIVSERLAVASNIRSCAVYVKSGMHLGIWQDIKTQVAQRFDLSSNPWDISTVVSFGATRTEAGKVIQIQCADTVGADINP